MILCTYSLFLNVEQGSATLCQTVSKNYIVNFPGSNFQTQQGSISYWVTSEQESY